MMTSQSECGEHRFLDPHTFTCVHCSYVCDPEYETPHDCNKYCPDYATKRHPILENILHQQTSTLPPNTKTPNVFQIHSDDLNYQPSVPVTVVLVIVLLLTITAMVFVIVTRKRRAIGCCCRKDAELFKHSPSSADMHNLESAKLDPQYCDNKQHKIHNNEHHNVLLNLCLKLRHHINLCIEPADPNTDPAQTQLMKNSEPEIDIKVGLQTKQLGKEYNGSFKCDPYSIEGLNGLVPVHDTGSTDSGYTDSNESVSVHSGSSINHTNCSMKQINNNNNNSQCFQSTGLQFNNTTTIPKQCDQSDQGDVSHSAVSNVHMVNNIPSVPVWIGTQLNSVRDGPLEVSSEMNSNDDDANSFSLSFHSDGISHQGEVDTTTEPQTDTGIRDRIWAEILELYEMIEHKLPRFPWIIGCMLSSDTLELVMDTSKADYDVDTAHDKICQEVPAELHQYILITTEGPSIELC